MYLKPLLVALASLALAPAVVAGERFTLADVAWLTGHWISADGRAEESWLGPAAGTMVGSFRWVIPGRMHVLEFLVIEETPDGVLFRFKHFDPDYRAWETDAPNTYRLIEARDHRAVFENVAWEGRVPKTMIYTRPDAERLLFLGRSPGEDDEVRLEYVRRESLVQDRARPP